MVEICPNRRVFVQQTPGIWSFPVLHIPICGRGPGLDQCRFHERDGVFAGICGELILAFWEDPSYVDNAGLRTGNALVLTMWHGRDRRLERPSTAHPALVNDRFPELQAVSVRLGEEADRRTFPRWVDYYALPYEVAAQVLARFLPGWNLIVYNDAGEEAWMPQQVGPSERSNS